MACSRRRMDAFAPRLIWRVRWSGPKAGMYMGGFAVFASALTAGLLWLHGVERAGEVHANWRAFNHLQHES